MVSSSTRGTCAEAGSGAMALRAISICILQTLDGKISISLNANLPRRNAASTKGRIFAAFQGNFLFGSQLAAGMRSYDFRFCAIAFAVFRKHTISCGHEIHSHLAAFAALHGFRGTSILLASSMMLPPAWKEIV